MEEELRHSRQNEVLFAISDKAGLCGITGFYNTNKANNKTELVLWLSKRVQNAQHYTEIIKTLLKHGFNDMAFNRIQCKSKSSDYILSSVFKKLGFTHEGTEKAGLLMADNTYHNLSVFAIIKAQYNEQSKFIVRANKIFQRIKKEK